MDRSESAVSKRKREEESGAEASLRTTAQPFIASATFSGARRGYWFGRGRLGQGYYADTPAGRGASDGADAALVSGPGLMQPPPPRLPNARVDGAQLLEQAERDAGGEGEPLEELDVRAVRRAVVALERRLKENLAARIKFADVPQKFLDSEVDLHEEVKRLGALAAAPELYPELVRLGAVPSLLSLLSHDNADIAAEAVEVLRELTDADAVQESDEALAGGAALGAALVGADGVATLLAALQRFDERVQEEAQAVHGLLAVLENLVEVSPALRDALLEHPQLLPSILARLTRKVPLDENRVYAAELVAVLLAGSDSAARALGAADGVDALLRAIAPFKRAPATPRAPLEEQLALEFVENCFDALCSAIMLDDNKLKFVQAEGIELMLLIIRNKGSAKTAALKALDFALTRCMPAAERLVDAAGLGAVFSAFSGRCSVAARRKRGVEAADEEETRAVSLIAALLGALPSGERRDRVAAKFVEEEHAKVDRLAELWFKYAARTHAAERVVATEEDPEERYVARLEGGLFTLQHCALILAQLWCIAHPGINDRLLRALTLGGGSLADVRCVLREYADNLGDDAEPPEGEETEVEKLQRRLAALTYLLYAPGEGRTPREEVDSEEEAHEAGEGEEGQPPAEGLLEDEQEDDTQV